MKIISINVGQPRAVQTHGKTVTTSIFKAPVAGPVLVKRLNVVGDKQSDLTVHGGADKAVYVYPAEHYAFWRKELPEVDLTGALLARTLRLKVCSKAPFTSATACRLARRSSSSHSPACRASNWASASIGQTW